MTKKLLTLATTALVGLTLTGTAPAYAHGGRHFGFHCHGKHFCHGKDFRRGRHFDDFRFDHFRFGDRGVHFRFGGHGGHDRY